MGPGETISLLILVFVPTVFLLYLATLMVPGLVTLIPNFWLLQRLGLINTYFVLIVPAAFSV